MGGSVLASSEGWPDLWFGGLDDLKPSNFFPRDGSGAFAPLRTRDSGVVAAAPADTRESDQDPVDLVVFTAAWTDWMEQWESQLMQSAANGNLRATNWCVLEPDGRTVLRSHPNSNMPTHPARGRRYFTNSPTSAETSGSRFEDLSVRRGPQPTAD